MDLEFPKNATIAMIKRSEKYLLPIGATVLEANDRLIVLSDSEDGLSGVNDCLNNRTILQKT